MLAANLPRMHSAPAWGIFEEAGGEDAGKEPKDPGFWLNFTVAIVLVLLGGVFAGLTLGSVLLRTMLFHS